MITRSGSYLSRLDPAACALSVGQPRGGLSVILVQATAYLGDEGLRVEQHASYGEFGSCLSQVIGRWVSFPLGGHS